MQLTCCEIVLIEDLLCYRIRRAVEPPVFFRLFVGDGYVRGTKADIVNSFNAINTDGDYYPCTYISTPILLAGAPERFADLKFGELHGFKYSIDLVGVEGFEPPPLGPLRLRIKGPLCAVTLHTHE